jgi:hypothetical protein
MRIHQPDQAIFRSVLPEDIGWEPFSDVLAGGASGNRRRRASKPGFYVIRVKLPSGVKLYTVMSGVFYIGLGSRFDEEQTAGVPARRRHRAPRRYPSFPLGKVRRLRHPDLGHRAAWS